MLAGAWVIYAANPDLYGLLEVQQVLKDGRLRCMGLNDGDVNDFSPQELELAPGSKTYKVAA